MSLTPEGMKAQRTAAVEALVSLAQVQFSALERVSALNLNATKSAFEDCVAHARELLNTTDVQQWSGTNAALVQPSMEKTVAHWRSVYDVLAQSHAEAAKLIGHRGGGFNQQFLDFLEALCQGLQAGSGVALEATRSALNAAESAYDSANRISRQAAELTEAGFAAAMLGIKTTRQAD